MHNNNVVLRLVDQLAVHCDGVPEALARELYMRGSRDGSFVCLALPRARFAQGGFLLLTDLRAIHTLREPQADLTAWDGPLTAWSLPYEWLAERARRNAAWPARAVQTAALGLHFGHGQHYPGTDDTAQATRAGRPPVAATPPSWYRRALRSIQQAIAQGHVYQVNLTQQRAYRARREDVLRLWLESVARFRPAFASLWQHQGQLTACLSPEELWSCDGTNLATAPIKGTALSDSRELQSDKNRAEHTMIVDLERNDLHRICRAGSVQVPILAHAVRYGGVEHLVSLVRGRLQAGVQLTQIVDAMAPGGSVTGAPKLAAIDYIQKLERRSRGIYCGALALTLAVDPYCGLAALPIRTAQWNHGWMRYGSGGGITIDSDTDSEYRELLRKQYWLEDYSDARHRG